MTDDRTHCVIHSDGAPRAIGPYSQAIAVGDWVYSAGQLGLDPATGQMVEGGVREQAVRALENMKAVLEAAGATLQDVVKATIYVVDLGDYAVVNEVWGTYFSTRPPARTAVQVSALPRAGLIEFDVVAHRSR